MVCFNSSRRGSIICASIFGLMAFLGILLICLKTNLLSAILSNALVILPKSLIYPNWVNLPTPLITSIYFFNVTNPKEFSKGSKPNLKEVGPYVFKEYHNKTKLIWNYNNYTVTYQQIRTWKFQPELSVGSLDDKILTLNAPAASANGFLLNANEFIRGAASLYFIIIAEKLFVTKTVDELLFKGYKDPILSSSKYLPQSPVAMDRFGYFYPRNGSDWYDGVFNMYTGQDDVMKMGKIAQWNYTHNVPYFPGKCGEVEGAGDLLSPFQKKTYIEMYSNDLCRPLRLEYHSEEKFKGINLNVYKMSRKYFANAKENPDNKCFNPENPDFPSGVFNISSCKFGAPILMSQPHFYQADPVFLDGVIGLKPDEKKHETVFKIEPLSGSPIEVKARFQVNFRLEKIPEIALFKNINSAVFPTVWFESKVDLPDDLFNKIWYLGNMTNIFTIMGCVLSGLGISIAVLILIFFKSKHSRVPNTDSQNAILNRSLFQESSSIDSQQS